MADANQKINEIDLALCRSAIYEALALGFRMPTEETVDRLIHEEQSAILAEIAALSDSNSRINGRTTLVSRVRALSQFSGEGCLQVLQAAHRFLFGHTAHPQAPPYETEYGEDTLFQQPHQLGDISGFYSAFGLRLNAQEYERVDHISCECEFMAFLARKEAYAIESDDVEMLSETRKAQRLFLKDHLGRFAPSFSKLLIRDDPEGFYGALGHLAYDFIQAECVRHKVEPGPEKLRLRPAAMADEDFTCGSGEELVQITQK